MILSKLYQSQSKHQKVGFALFWCDESVCGCLTHLLKQYKFSRTIGFRQFKNNLRMLAQISIYVFVTNIVKSLGQVLRIKGLEKHISVLILDTQLVFTRKKGCW